MEPGPQPGPAHPAPKDVNNVFRSHNYDAGETVAVFAGASLSGRITQRVPPLSISTMQRLQGMHGDAAV